MRQRGRAWSPASREEGRVLALGNDGDGDRHRLDRGPHSQVERGLDHHQEGVPVVVPATPAGRPGGDHMVQHLPQLKLQEPVKVVHLY